MALPSGMTPISNIKGNTGSLAFATAETVPWTESPHVTMVGAPDSRGAHFEIPLPIPGPELLAMRDETKGYRDAAEVFSAATETLQDSAVTTLLGDSLSGSSIAVRKSTGQYYVESYGAAGDGVTDDTAAVQAALDAVGAAGGGTVAFGSDVYLMRGMVRVPSNCILDGSGATINKFAGAGFSQIAFAALGDSGWKENVTIKNFRFQGQLPTTGVMLFWGHRVRNVTIKNCVVRDAITSGHCVDLQGCDGVLIEKCTFSGAAPGVGREYAECIQIDASIRQGSPAQSVPNQVYDGTPTRCVTVRQCRFIRQGTYLAPKAIGAHGVSAYRPYEQITFEDNYLERPTYSETYKGIINFMAANHVTIKRNIFNVEGGHEFTANVVFHPVNYWVSAGDVDTTNPTVLATDPMQGIRLTSANNQFAEAYTRGSGMFFVPTLESGFSDYEPAEQVRVSYNDGQATLTGVLTVANSDTLTSGAAGATAFVLPPWLRPLRNVRVLCAGSPFHTFYLIIRATGVVSVARYSQGGVANPYLAMSASWPVA